LSTGFKSLTIAAS